MEPFVLKQEPGRPGLFYLDKWMDRYPGLTVGFTSRLGGVSGGAFDSLNCGLHVADRQDDVIANRSRIGEAIGMPIENWVYGEQVHGSRVAVVSSVDRGKGTLRRETALQDTDAFITRESGVVLGAMFADCVPLYFFDPVTRTAGLAHAGWKGTVRQIARQTVEAMRSAFGTKPSDLAAAIGPSIGRCCYEVDGRVIAQVQDTLLDVLPEEERVSGNRERFYEPSEPGKYKLDLQQLNRQIMIKAGILPSSIELTEWCTSCSVGYFYSHRKERGKTGRMVAWISIGSSGEYGGNGTSGFDGTNPAS